MSTPAMPVTLTAFKSLNRNTLRGFATIRLGRSLTIKDISVHVSHGKRWAALPSKPVLDGSGNAKRNDAGKVQYTPILEWADRDAANRFSEAVCGAVEREYPEAFADDSGAAP